MLYIAPAIRTKLLYKHDVREHEIEEAFANREGGFLEDERAEHITIPPTQWFIAETNHGRRLKIVFIADSGRLIIKSAYEPNGEEIRIYRKYGGTP